MNPCRVSLHDGCPVDRIEAAFVKRASCREGLPDTTFFRYLLSKIPLTWKIALVLAVGHTVLRSSNTAVK